MSTPSLQAIIAELKLLEPTSRQSTLAATSNVLSGLLSKTIDTHNTTSAIFIFSLSNKKYLLKAEYGAENATAKEIAWYDAVSKNSLVPTLIDSFLKDHYAFLILEYIDEASTLDELVQAKAITPKDTYARIDYVLQKNEELFKSSRPQKVKFHESDRFYLEKYKTRTLEAQNFPYLRKLLETPNHRINDRLLHSPTYYISRIANDPKLHSYLTPQSLGLIHGDLHCGNILATAQRTYTIDPNGALAMPLEYDYGKIFHSIHGAYGSIMRKNYSLEILENDKYTFSVQVPEVYTTIYQNLQQQLSEQQFLRGLYAEAMHFATLLPHHASEQVETLALFLRCIYIFDELFYNF